MDGPFGIASRGPPTGDYRAAGMGDATLEVGLTPTQSQAQGSIFTRINRMNGIYRISSQSTLPYTSHGQTQTASRLFQRYGLQPAGRPVCIRLVQSRHRPIAQLLPLVRVYQLLNHLGNDFPHQRAELRDGQVGYRLRRFCCHCILRKSDSLLGVSVARLSASTLIGTRRCGAGCGVQ